MAIMGFNPAAEMSQLRTQRSLAMQAQGAPAAGAADPAAAADPATAAALAGAAAPGAAADAAIGAAGVMEPPSTSKIVLQSVLKGAMTGASVMLGVKQFGPLLTKIPFLKGPIGSLVPPAGALGFLSKLPIVGKVLPMMAKGGFGAFAITALVGAGVGAIFGAFGGLKKSKAAAAEYAEAMAAQQAQQTPPPGDPVNAPAPAPAPAPGGMRAKSWIISRSGATSKTGGSFGHYTTRKGDTIQQLAKRFHTTPAEIRKLNPDLKVRDGGAVDGGDKLKLKRKVVPNAQAWVA